MSGELPLFRFIRYDRKPIELMINLRPLYLPAKQTLALRAKPPDQTSDSNNGST